MLYKINYSFNIIKNDFIISVKYLMFVFPLLLLHIIFNIFLSNLILFSFLWLLLIYILSIKEFKIIVNNFNVFAGKVSYSAYLVHFAVLDLTQHLIIEGYRDKILVFIIYLFFVIAITLVLSKLINFTIEEPFRKFGKRFIKHQ